MGLAKVRTSTLNGIEATPVEVEVKASDQGSNFTIIGLADNAIREARDRVATAIFQSGFRLPGRVLVNLAPAELRKEGAAFDAAIAIGILVASHQFKPQNIGGVSIHGELSLSGMLKPVRGATAFAIRAFEDRMDCVLVPSHNLGEARLINEVRSYGIRSLKEMVQCLAGDWSQTEEAIPPMGENERARTSSALLSLDDVRGQSIAKRALMIAAVGGHNLLMIGPPGCGKSMLAERFPTLLPPLTLREKIEVLKIHSACGNRLEKILDGERPFRSPHHVISDAGLMGGGSNPRPGEVSLAHRGVLFLDEFPEFRRSTLEALRAPLETGKVTITRARANMTFPARIQLIAAMNPCPCGRLGDKRCKCSAISIQKYFSKLSEPILDRIDLQVELDPVAVGEMLASDHGSAPRANQIVANIEMAKDFCASRQQGQNCLLQLQELMEQSEKAPIVGILEKVSAAGRLSARGYVRVLRVARSIADLEATPKIQSRHVIEALGLRGLERLKRWVQ